MTDEANANQFPLSKEDDPDASYVFVADSDLTANALDHPLSPHGSISSEVTAESHEFHPGAQFLNAPLSAAEPILTQDKTSVEVAQSESNKNAHSLPTTTLNSESNGSTNEEVVCNTHVSELTTTIAEADSIQCGDEAATDTANLADSNSNLSDNVSGSDLNHSDVVEIIEMPGIALDTESEPTQSAVEENQEGESHSVEEIKGDRDFEVLTSEGIQNNKGLGLDQGDGPVLTNDLPINSSQASFELEQNLEIKSELAGVVDASSSSEHTDGQSVDNSQGCIAEKGTFNGLVSPSQTTDAKSSSEDVETTADTVAKIGRNEAENGNGIAASTDNDTNRAPISDNAATVEQVDSEAINCHILYEKEDFPADLAGESDSQTVARDSAQASSITPEGNSLSEILEPVFHDKGVSGSYKSILIAPFGDAASESVIESGDPCPAESTKLQGMKTETVVENLDVDRCGSVGSLPVNVVLEPESFSLENDKLSSSVNNDVKPEAETGSSATQSEEKASALSNDEVHLEVTSGIASQCAGSQPASCENPDRESCLGDSVKSPVDVKPDSVAETNVSESDAVNGSADTIDSDGKMHQKIKAIEEVSREECSISSPKGSAIDTSDGQNSLVEVVKRPFYYMIRVPRYDDDENLKEQIKNAQTQVDEKTKIRDAIRAEKLREKAKSKKYFDAKDSARSELSAARDLFKAKRDEMESLQVSINSMNSASELKSMDEKIRSMEQMMQHETLELKEEKSYILEIKKLKQVRDKLSSKLGSQRSVQDVIDQQMQLEERMKALRKEVDILRDSYLKAEAAFRNADKIVEPEKAKQNAFSAQYDAADRVRQEAYAHLQSLRKRSYEKNKYFYMYKDDANAASDLVSKGDKEELQNHCINQVERFMELWNQNVEFRKEYIRCNLRSTVRRLQTLDGRSLGPDEDPPVIPNFVSAILTKNKVMPSVSALKEEKIVAPVETESNDDKPLGKVGGQKNPTAKSKKAVKPALLGNGLATISNRVEIEEADLEEPKLTKEEEELARKTEELRKEAEAAILRQQRLIQEKAKAKEAMERKKRNAEKARVRAELRAQKEAEQKEKEKEKKARKKEKRKVIEEVNGYNEGEPSPVSETPTEIKQSETIEKAVAMTKKPLHFAKQTKPKSIPPPLRNRGKRRMQTWMWVLLISIIIFALFLIGNSSFPLPRFGF